MVHLGKVSIINKLKRRCSPRIEALFNFKTLEILNTIAAFLNKLFQWWFTVMPWEQAIHIRRGKVIKLKGKGLYLRIPFIDSVFIQTIRMRMVDAPVQTVSTKDGHTITIKSAIGYAIGDIQKLYNTLYHPDMTLTSMVMGYIGEYVRDNEITAITPKKIQEVISGKISAEQYGLKDLDVKITTFANVKTFRIINDNSWLNEGLKMDALK